VEYPDRFKTAHMRHKDIDHHQIEAGVFESAKPGFAAIGYRHFKAVAFEIDLDGHANHRIVIDNENPCHVSPPEAKLLLSIVWSLLNCGTSTTAIPFWFDAKS